MGCFAPLGRGVVGGVFFVGRGCISFILRIRAFFPTCRVACVGLGLFAPSGRGGSCALKGRINIARRNTSGKPARMRRWNEKLRVSRIAFNRFAPAGRFPASAFCPDVSLRLRRAGVSCPFRAWGKLRPERANKHSPTQHVGKSGGCRNIKKRHPEGCRFSLGCLRNANNDDVYLTTVTRCVVVPVSATTRTTYTPALKRAMLRSSSSVFTSAS